MFFFYLRPSRAIGGSCSSPPHVRGGAPTQEHQEAACQKLSISLPYLTFDYKTDYKKDYVRRGNFDQISLRELLGFAHCDMHKSSGMPFRYAYSGTRSN
jgi:hypothetical protein